ncbi:MAG TPA: hypothetical protein VKV77_11080 [Methylovirgula sp.]|nr:hypothetical protein [Methylovirgula sp.]
MSRTSILFSRMFLATTLSLAGSVGAHAFTVTAEQRAACTPDALRLCSSEIPDVGKIVACMQAKMASLSPACRAVFQTAGLAHHPRERLARATPNPSNRTRLAAYANERTHVAASTNERAHAIYAHYRPAALHRHPVREALEWRHHRAHRASALYASNRDSYFDESWMRGHPSHEAMRIVRKVMMGYTMACQNHSIPADLCDVYDTTFMSRGRPSGYQNWNNEHGAWGAPAHSEYHYAQSGDSWSGEMPALFFNTPSR